MPGYVRGLETEIKHFSHPLREDYAIQTIFFGGGTPSLIPARYIGSILSTVRECFDVGEDPEISMEANPNGLSSGYLSEIRKHGINRVSIGMQSAITLELAILDRQHTMEDVQSAVMETKEAGIRNINLDLMFGIPHQSLPSLRESVNRALELQPHHLSVYGLSLHEGTALIRKIETGAVEAIDEDLAGDMYAWLMDYLPEQGFDQYEISNWSAGGNFLCQHNLQYWLNLDYLGIGAGAHSYVGAHRWSNVLGIQAYTQALEENPAGEFFHRAVDEQIHLELMDSIKETMMMGLRLTEMGVGLQTFSDRFSLNLLDLYQENISRLLDLQLVELIVVKGEKSLRLTKKGRMFGNQVFLEFI